MKSILHKLELQTKQDIELVNITHQVIQTVNQSGIQAGFAHVTTMHTTTAITVNEGLEDIEHDLITLLTRLVPVNGEYHHARFLHSDGQTAVNAHAHLQAALLGPNVIFPIDDGRLVMGERQTIYFVELDGPQRRHLVIQALGDYYQKLSNCVILDR
jgi:secondary thiamine-phosphate synthase enzyme